MRVCLVAATHPSNNPRLIREADSLAGAGHDVRVVAPSFMTALRDRDMRLLQNRAWRLEVIDFCPGGMAGTYRAYVTRGKCRVLQKAVRLTGRRRYVDGAYTPAMREMTALASAEPADWFIAHAHRSLPVAAAAAHKWDARLGFDCEDLLGEDRTGLAGQVEKAYLPQCSYISVPSQAMGANLALNHGPLPMIVLYNFFPTALVSGMSPPSSRNAREVVKLHWFSQTIGEGRGIEDAIIAISSLGSKVELHLRGEWARGYEEKVRGMAERLKVSLHVHPVLDHDLLIRQMEEFDIGLALEPLSNHNAALTQSNKIGSYFLAGMAIAATDTPGQREVLGDNPQAGFLYPSGKPEMLAAGLKRWLNNRQALCEAQKASWDIGRDRFCWDVEQTKFFAALGIASPVGYLQTH